MASITVMVQSNLRSGWATDTPPVATVCQHAGSREGCIYEKNHLSSAQAAPDGAPPLTGLQHGQLNPTGRGTPPPCILQLFFSSAPPPVVVTHRVS